MNEIKKKNAFCVENRRIHQNYFSSVGQYLLTAVTI